MTDGEVELATKDILELKAQGNSLFGEQNYVAAIDCYMSALEVTEDSRVDNERAACWANVGACRYQLKEWKACAEACSEGILENLQSLQRSNLLLALKIDKQYVKALRRRATANENLNTWQALQTSHHDYTELVKLSDAPDRYSYERKLRAIKPRLDEAQEREKTEMIGKLKDLGNSVLGKFGMSTDMFNMQPDGKGGYSMSFDQSK